MALAKLMLEPVNLLVMDEPTNHLDMRSKDILKDALLKYDGTLIIVSHDRSFLEGLTDKVIEFTGGGIKEHIGDIHAFLQVSGQDTLADSMVAKKEKKPTKANGKSPNDYKERKAQEKELRKQKSSVKRKEDRVSELEKEIAECDEIMLDPTKCQKKMNDKKWLDKYQSLQTELATAMLEWEAACEKMEALEARD